MALRYVTKLWRTSYTSTDLLPSVGTPLAHALDHNSNSLVFDLDFCVHSYVLEYLECLFGRVEYVKFIDHSLF